MNTDLQNFPTSTNHYEILGIDVDADTASVRAAYRRLILRFHPDKYPSVDDKPQATEIARRIMAAYRVLSDDDARNAYDRSVRDDVEIVDAREEGLVSLLAILAEIHEREDLFRENQIETIEPELRELIVENLLDDGKVKETVVGVFPLHYLPSGLKVEPPFDEENCVNVTLEMKKGTLVFTTLRVLFAHKVEWRGTSTDSKGVVEKRSTDPMFSKVLLKEAADRRVINFIQPHGFILAVPWFDINRIEIVQEGRVSGSTRFTLHRRDEGPVECRPAAHSITRFLALASLWGIAIDQNVENRGGTDLRLEMTSGLFQAILILVVIYAALFVLQAFAGRDLMTWTTYGPLQFALFLVLGSAGAGAGHTLTKYRRLRVSDLAGE